MPESNAEIANPSPSDARPERYDPQTIEQKWSERWAQNPDLYKAEPATSARKKYYLLEMLPYPSGALHMGHVRNYSIGDALARYMWMQGYNVLHPMGWDAFGLPAENAAIKNQTPPQQWTLHNIAAMKAQMKRLGFAYDWSTEITTCLPDYYRWNQWFFLKLLREGPGLPQARQGELVFRVRHRAGQRAGAAQRMLLAARDHAGRAARTGAVVPAHHRLRRRTVDRAGFDARLARARHRATAPLDRPQRRHATSISNSTALPALRATRSPSSPRAWTRSTARPRCSWRPSIRSSPTWSPPIPSCATRSTS